MNVKFCIKPTLFKELSMIENINLLQLISPYLLNDECGKPFFACGYYKFSLMLCFLLCIIKFKLLLN